jgi:protein gp37
MAMWNPFRGCRKCSEGCKFCYIHKGDSKRGVDTNKIVKTDKFTLPIDRYKRGKNKGEYKIKSGEMVYLCFSSDFLLTDADPWREECFAMIRERQDLHFLFLTKRIGRFMDCIPEDWGDGYENVTVGCTVENQVMVDEKLSIFDQLPIKHKNIILQPLLESVDISEHLKDVELVVVGGESDYHARPLDYDWVLDVREQCKKAGVKFEFRQCGTHFIKDGKKYTLKTRDLCSQARKANINL